MAYLFEVDLENRNQSLPVSLATQHEAIFKHDDLPQESAQTLNEKENSSQERQ